MNNYPGLTLEFNAPTNKVDFMDFTISITNGRISTSLFEKPLNLHLYIPPHSAHPPGDLPGIIHSTLFRIFTLCLDHNDRILCTKVFSKDYKLVAIRVITSNLYSTKLLTGFYPKCKKSSGLVLMWIVVKITHYMSIYIFYWIFDPKQLKISQNQENPSNDSKDNKNWWKDQILLSCYHMICYTRFILHINLHILLMFLIMAWLKIQKSC